VTIDPRLEALLRGWESRTKSITNLRCEFTRYTLEQAFPVERVEYGRASYIRPDKGHLDLWKTPERKKEDYTEIFICDGQAIHQYTFRTKEYIQHLLPASQQGENIMQGTLPFLFGLGPAEAKSRFAIRLEKEDTDWAWIEVLPRFEEDRQNFRVVKVVLNKTTFLPGAMLVVEPIGNQYKYEITRIEPNPKPAVSAADVQRLQPPKGWQQSVNRLGGESAPLAPGRPAGQPLPPVGSNSRSNPAR
jgi:TIGR03009 family protein